MIRFPKGKAAAPTSRSWTHSRSRRLDGLYEWFVINGLSRSLINPVIRLSRMGSISTESSDGLPKGRGRMFGDEAVLVIDLPGAIQVLAHFTSSVCMGPC